MKKNLKIVAITLCALFMFTAFMPAGFALRGRTFDTEIKSSRNPIVESKKSAEDVKKAVSTPDTVKAAKAADGELSIRFSDVIYELKNPSRCSIESSIIAIDDSETFSSRVWFLNYSGKALFYNSQRAALTRVSLAISSTSARTVSVCASANASGMMNSMGITTLKIQRFYKSRWMTVSTVSNVYNYNTSYFLYSTVRSCMVSGCYYRAEVTFFGDNGYTGTTVTKTSGAIRCR